MSRPRRSVARYGSPNLYPFGGRVAAFTVALLLVACASEHSTLSPEIPGSDQEPLASGRSASQGDEATTERTAYRQAVGGLGAGYLYQTHLAIGSTAELLGRRGYRTDEVVALMDSAISMAQNVDSILSEVSQQRLGPADTLVLEDMREVNRLLIDQARALQQFARNPTAENADAFERERAETWTRLKQLLNVAPGG